jgi:hypothetical protein
VWRVRERCTLGFPNTNSELVSIIGDTGIEAASFIHFVNANKQPGEEDLRLGQIEKSEIFQYPPTMKYQSNWNNGNAIRTKPSNHPRYLLPTTAYSLARRYGLEACVEATRVYARCLQDPPQKPKLAQTYVTCIIKNEVVYAIYSTDDRSAFHIIGVKNKRRVQATLFLALLNNLPVDAPCEGTQFKPENMGFSESTDTEQVGMYKTMFEHTCDI